MTTDLTTLSIEELAAQQAAITDALNAKRVAEKAEAVVKAKAFVAKFGLTAADIFTTTKRSSGRKVAAKYSDGKGNTWSGRGLKPKWLASALGTGATLESFLIKDEAL